MLKMKSSKRKNIGLLFDLNRMSDERASAMRKIAERQTTQGGFSWFPGGRDSWYITQYIVEGMGHLNVLGVKGIADDRQSMNMISKSVSYIDQKLAEYYENLKKNGKKERKWMERDHLDNLIVHYLYARSFFIDFPIPENTKTAFDYFIGQADQYWLQKGLYQEALLGLALDRFGKEETSQKIVASLKDRALNHEELGMYWKYNTGFYWYQLPIETHATMIELFCRGRKGPRVCGRIETLAT